MSDFSKGDGIFLKGLEAMILVSIPEVISAVAGFNKFEDLSALGSLDLKLEARDL